MFCPATTLNGIDWTCARCDREPGHVDDLEAFTAGYTSSRRELHGGEPFVICAACTRSEAHVVYRENVEYWTGLGASPVDVLNMLTRPEERI